MGEEFVKKVELVAWLQNPNKSWDAEDPASCGARGCFDEESSSDIPGEEIEPLYDAALEHGLTSSIIVSGQNYTWLNETGVALFEALHNANEKYETRKENIFRETSGRGHGAVLDQSAFAFSIDNLTRASTLFLCAPQYASHLQQSLRRATAERGFYLPENLRGTRGEDLMKEQFSLYDKMQNAHIPSEDARYILPLYTKTTIQPLLDARELMHLHSMAMREGVPLEVRDTVEQMFERAREIAPRLMKDRENNYEVLAWMPASQLFAPKNKTIEELIYSHSTGWNTPEKVILLDNSGIQMNPESIKKAVMERDEAELANLKHYHFSFLAPMSLASFHQATRQRTWDQGVETMMGAIFRGKYVTPPSIIGSEFEGAYRELNERSIESVRKTIDNIGNINEYNDFIGTVPHSLIVYDLIHVNGWNAIYSIGKRTCTQAQWEIRRVARQMADLIRDVSPEVGKYAVPQGIIYDKCPEKKPCNVCFKQ